MSNKRIVHYKPCLDDVIMLGHSALVYPVDHPSMFVSNRVVCHTSKVVHIDDKTGVFETLNTVYKPLAKDK